MDVSGLEPIEQTALLTEYARALDSSSPRPILADPLAGTTVAQIDYEFTDLGASPSVVALVALRAKMLDERIKAFNAECPNAVVVELGAGFSSALFRVDPAAAVDWYCVELPGVSAMREALLPAHPSARSVAGSVLKPGWVDDIPADRPTLIFADGVFAFFDETEVITLLQRVTGHFEHGAIAFNDYGPVSKLNQLIGRLATRRNANSPHSQWRFPGFVDARLPEQWNPALALIDEASGMQRPETQLFPAGLRVASRLSGRIPAIARKARILQYRF